MSGSNGQRVACKPAQPAEDVRERWQRGDKVKARKLEWLLPGRMIVGSLAVVEGETDVGKSTFIAALVASVTTGRPWLGRPKSTPRNVLWISNEEDFASLVRPRLESAGADVTRVLPPAEDEHDEPMRIMLPDSLSFLRESISALDVAVVVIEPLASALAPTIDLNQTVSIRSVLDPLQKIAIATRCTFIVTRGLRKDKSGPRLSHGVGSAGIADTARSVMVIDAPDPLKADRIARVLKCKRAKRTPALSYKIVDNGQGPVMSEMAEMSQGADIEADSGMMPGERSVRADARNILRNLLEKGWVRCSVIKAACEDAMVSLQTMRRAYEELGIQTRQKRDDAGSFWEWGAPEGGMKADPPSPGTPDYVGKRVRKKAKKAEKKQD